MADSKSIAGEVEGDYSVVKVQLAGGGKEDQVKRPTKGTQLVWGGTDPSSPWGHLAALIEKSGGSVTYTFIHASDLKQPIAIVEEKPEEKHDEAQADAPKQEEHHDAPTTPGQPERPHAGGAEGHGPLFENGLEFQFGGNPARVWAHPHCLLAGPRPLVIALHGVNGKARNKHTALNDTIVHVGHIAAKLIDDGKVTPLVIAAPTEYSDTPWGSFDLAKFVAAVEAQLVPLNVQIDHDRVSLEGHSGAGGCPGKGLNKIAHEGAQFDGHKLLVLGIADTCITNDNAKAYADGLKDNQVTTIYALHKGTGGWPAYGGSQMFARALGADQKGKADAAEDEQEVDDYYDNGGKKPLRVSIRVKQAKLVNHHKEWKATHGYPTELGAHSDMVPMWFWWALPRFYPATEEDKHAGLQAHPAEHVPVDEPQAPVVTGGEWSDVPKGPPIWTPTGGDPKDMGEAVWAPTSGFYWPVRNPKVYEGRGVSFIAQTGKGYNPGRGFMANRPAGVKDPDRYHAGIDVFGDHNDIIVACEAVVIVKFYEFYPFPNPLVSCLLVFSEKSGLTINYGEVDNNSLKRFHLNVGDSVVPGQPIALVGRMVQDSMLHFETYPGKQTRNIPFWKKDGAAGRKNYFNPTSYLMALAKKGK